MEVVVVAAIAVITTLVATLIQKKITDVDLVKSLKSEIKKINKEMRETKQDTQKLNKLISKNFEIQKKMMGQTIKPMMISSVLTLTVFFMISVFFKGAVLSLPVSLPFIGNKLNWFWIFILSSTISSLIFRKVLNIEF
ncbi:MAG: hypothetical protein DRP14_04570 [Candidatus Aenigmatarchaeota archaeon]|nr:MAG: hypothetical protein DRP14_04570 [Candidatus Aenigmarchaeota archaeon]